MGDSRLFRRGRGAAFLAATIAAVLALLGPAGAEAADLSATTTLTGTYTLVHVDGTVGHPGADGFQQEIIAGGRAYNVSLKQGLAFRSGDSVQLKGRLNGTTLQVQSSKITAFAPDSTVVSGTTKVLVLLASWTAADAMTPASAAKVLAADSAWFTKSSYGQLSLSTTVSSWVHVSPPAVGLCSDSAVSNDLTSRALTAAGYNGNAFDRVIVYFPQSSDASCAHVAGFAEAPGNRVWLNGVMDARTTLHEQGHNYGLYHAHSAVCRAPGTTTPAAGPDALADNCTFSDYGDPFDAMGASSLVGEYSASQKDVLGWLGSGREVQLTANSSTALVPYEQQSTAVHAASFNATATRSYWFENRSAVGNDAMLPTGATNGLLVHVDDASIDAKAQEYSPWAPQQAYLLDQSPGDRWLGTSVLPYGQSWTSPEGVTFTVGHPVGGTVVLRASLATGPALPAGVASGQKPSLLSSRLVSGLRTQTVREGETVVMSGTAVRPDGSGADGASVALQVSPHGQRSWATVKTMTVTGPGFLSAVVRAKRSSDYRLHIAASATEAGSSSASFTVVVRPLVMAALSKPLVGRGHRIGLNVVIPGHGYQVVSVQRYVNHRWVTYAKARLGHDGRRSVVIRPATKGRFLYRFVKAADSFHLAATSKALRVRVV